MLAADNLVDKTKTLFGERQTAGKTAGQLGAEDGTSAESDSWHWIHNPERAGAQSPNPPLRGQRLGTAGL